MLVDNNSFLTQVTRFFEKSKTSGTVYLNMKRFDHEAKKKGSTIEVTEETEYSTLVRASCGNAKISTLVQPNDFEKFLDAYGNIMKVQMDALKKKERKKVKKTKPTA
ncbi:RNA-binding signal recognition particle subunit srp14 [Basidiobolus ranarum]|uniref:Signal recognition particle subunit SRP14 n=1 Tax=Basidiobolus ranarum TaxID=34480 RepID=A0ABR2W086_9FUNG